MIGTLTRSAPLNVRFEVPGDPQGKGRHRSRIATNKAGKSFVANYTPEKTANYESLVSLSASQAMAGRRPTNNPCAVTIDVYCKVPVSWSAVKLARAVAGSVLPTGRPDLDNIEKSILDGMNAVVFRDDALVCDVVKRKRYAERARVEVAVRELDGLPAR